MSVRDRVLKHLRSLLTTSAIAATGLGCAADVKAPAEPAPANTTDAQPPETEEPPKSDPEIVEDPIVRPPNDVVCDPLPPPPEEEE